jgi:retinol dehydrogenase 12
MSAGPLCVVTGASRGIGRATARRLGAAGARLVLIARDPDRLKDAGREIALETGAAVEIEAIDLSAIGATLRLAERLAKRHPRIDVLVNNHTRIFPQRTVTEDGLEANFALNFLSYFVLARALLPAVTSGGRIVNVAAEVHRFAALDFDDLQLEKGVYDPRDAYNQAKLAVILITGELARQAAGTGITVNSLDPGVVDTDALRAYRGAAPPRPGATPPVEVDRGADTPVHLAISPEVAGVTGKYFRDRQPVVPSEEAIDRNAARRLWKVSTRIVERCAPHASGRSSMEAIR